jgi:hypothetical protein
VFTVRDLIPGDAGKIVFPKKVKNSFLKEIGNPAGG